MGDLWPPGSPPPPGGGGAEEGSGADGGYDDTAFLASLERALTDAVDTRVREHLGMYSSLTCTNFTTYVGVWSGGVSGR